MHRHQRPRSVVVARRCQHDPCHSRCVPGFTFALPHISSCNTLIRPRGAGGWVRTFGRGFGNLSASEPSRLPAVSLQLCPSGADGQTAVDCTSGTVVHAINGSSNDGFFMLPEALAPGGYSISLSRCGAQFPVPEDDSRLYVSPAGSPKGSWAAARSQRVLNVNTTEELFAALNTTAAEGGGVILLGHGTYQIPANQSISLPPFTVLRGATNAAGASLATLRFDVRPCGEHASCSNPLPAASVPSYFIGGNATFAVEDMTIYVLGLYNMIIRDSGQSSYVRIARVRIRADYFFRFGERFSFGAILLQKTIIAFAKARSGHT